MFIIRAMRPFEKELLRREGRDSWRATAVIWVAMI